MYRIRVFPSEGEPWEKLIEAGEVVVGRSSTAGIVLHDPLLSRQHALLRLEGNRLVAEDMGSRNGTFLNGQAVTAPMTLVPGDRITIGSSSLLVEEGKSSRVTILPGREGLSEGTILRSAADLLRDQESSAPAISATSDSASLARLATRLRTVSEIHTALARTTSLDEVLGMVLDRAFEQLRPEQAVIFLRGGTEGFRAAATRSLPGKEYEIRLSRSLVAEVAEKGMAALVLDTATDVRFAAAESLMISGIRSLVAAPLLDTEGSLGMIVLESTVGVRRFAEADLELLVSLASATAMKIRNLSLADEAAARRRLEQELALARRIQEGLLPERMPEIAGWTIVARNAPSRHVSGDIYQMAMRRGGEECAILVADVSGKGIAAALLTATLDALVEAPIDDGLPPDEICARLSRGIFRRTPTEKYATAFLAILEPATGKVRYTNAGHNPAILVRAGGAAERLGPTGVPVGLFEKAVYKAGEVEMAPGDTLVIYTDGFTEATNPADDEYGLPRLERVGVEGRGLAAEALADSIEADLASFAEGVPFGDDRTLVVLQRLASPAA